MADGHSEFPAIMQHIQQQLLHEPVAVVGGYGTHGRPRSLLDLAREVRPDTADALSQSLTILAETERFARIPVIGVCGLMNSGKSTTTAFHLSPEGRSRVNIGDSSLQGTHRFVLWVPESWRNLKNQIHALLQQVFPNPPEDLADEVDKAAKQYNARDDRLEAFKIPLLAFDTALDAHGIALLDCPDIQRTHDKAQKHETAHIRQEALRAAARLCSTFFVVTSAEQQESSDLETLMTILRADEIKLPLYYVVTKIHADDPANLHDAEQRLAELGVQSKVRGIFLSPRLLNHHPHGFPEGIRFQGAHDPEIELLSVIKELNVSELQALYLAERLEEVMTRIRETSDAIQTHFSNGNQKARLAREQLLQFLDGRFVDEDGAVRSILSKKIVSSIQASIDRTTPWYFAAGKVTRRAKNWVKETLRGPEAVRQEEITQGKALLEELRVTRGRDFGNFLQGRRWLPPDYTNDQIMAVWEHALGKLHQHSDVWCETGHDRNALDRITASMWDSIPDSKKNLAIVAAPALLVAALASVLFIGPIALGGSAVLYSASATELFLALGIGVMAQTSSSHMMQQFIAQRIGRPQISLLFALLQDLMGIPRASDAELKIMKDNQRLQLTESSLEQLAILYPVLTPPFGVLKTEALDSLVASVRSVQRDLEKTIES